MYMTYYLLLQTINQKQYRENNHLIMYCKVVKPDNHMIDDSLDS